MGKPTETDGPFNGAGVNPTGGAVGDDDVYFTPGNPEIDLAISKLLVAYVETKDDILANDDNIRTEMPFVHNFSDSPSMGVAASAVRDVPSSELFWVIQVVGAYEGLPSLDHDPDRELGVLGQAGVLHSKSAMIFLETIRDTHAHPTQDESALIISFDLLIQRIVLHEIVHHFGVLHVVGQKDYGIMDPATNLKGPEQLNSLTNKHIAAVRSTLFPL